MASLGIKVIVHSNPSKRASWNLNGETGWHAGPSMNHCRCVKCFVHRTRTVIDADTAEFFPHSVPFLSVILQDFLVQAATDVTSILAKSPSSTTPSLQAGDEV